MHGPGNGFIGLKPKMADKEGILIQNDISKTNKKCSGEYITEGKRVTRRCG